MGTEASGSGRERVLLALKTSGPQTAASLAKAIGVTTMAVRQHLAVLQAGRVVDFVDEKRRVGRPARLWRLTAEAQKHFPDGHADFAIQMLAAVRDSLGEQGLIRLRHSRTQRQIESYRARMPGSGASLEERVVALAQIRCREGYMAESRPSHDGSLELAEYHCCIAAAAQTCPRLCTDELSLFRGVLGERVTVEPLENMLTGDRRCMYRISEGPSST